MFWEAEFAEEVELRDLFLPEAVARLRRAGLHVATGRRAREVQRRPALRRFAQGDIARDVDERPAWNRVRHVHRAVCAESGPRGGEAVDRALGWHPIRRAWLLCTDGAGVVGAGYVRLSLQIERGGRRDRPGPHDRSGDLHHLRGRHPKRPQDADRGRVGTRRSQISGRPAGRVCPRQYRELQPESSWVLAAQSARR